MHVFSAAGSGMCMARAHCANATAQVVARPEGRARLKRLQRDQADRRQDAW
jgi:hypothetical protein